MAIHPQYADAILAGQKRVEFRKRQLAADVDTVVIYATAPVKAIIGEFTIAGAVVAPPAQVWTALGAVGAIDKSAFDAYYAGSETAIAISVKAARRYAVQVTLAAIIPEPAVPQSFTYITEDIVTQVHERAGERQHMLLRAAAALAQLIAHGGRKTIAPVVTLRFGSFADASEDQVAAQR
jgi:predicted transcriptional regulator